MKPRKPRTITGRVALHLCVAVVGTARQINRMRGDLEHVLMRVCAQATQQGLQPVDFDNDRGADALHVIFLALSPIEPEIIHVTPEWRRVVISARDRRPLSLSELGWRHAPT